MPDRRIFLAIDISEEARKVCSRHVDGLRAQFPNTRVGWERPEKMHVTLKFLGDTSEGIVTRLRDSFSQVGKYHRAFRLQLDGAGVFPSRLRPRILWIGLSPSGPVSELQRAIDERCSEMGFDRERRSFTPHVTIGRVKDLSTARPLTDAHLKTEIKPISFDVSHFVMYQSELRSTGSVYSRIASFPIGPE